MYIELTAATKSVAQVIKARRSLRLPDGRIDDVVSDASLRIANRFLVGEYVVKNWQSLIYLEVKHQFFDKKTQRIDLQSSTDAVPIMAASIRDESGYISDLIADTAIDGKRIVRDLFITRLRKTRRANSRAHHEREYKAAIDKIAGYTSRAHIYRYAVEIRSIFDTLRVKKDDKNA